MLSRDGETARLRLAREDKSVNVLDAETMVALESAIDELERDPPQILRIESGMPGCFVAGADIDAIAGVTSAAEAAALALRGQQLCSRIEQLPSISIALVQGACMGGGLELALSCDRIVAIHDAKTQLALPEIKIGIHPGFGGCVRLPRRVGWPKAIEMILSGSSVDAKKAKRIRLADLACHAEEADAAVAYLAKRGKRAKVAAGPFWLRLPLVKQLFFAVVRRQVLARLGAVDVASAYPAVLATLDLLPRLVGRGDASAYPLEAESLGRMAVTPSCKSLIRVFRLGEALKKQAAVKQGKEAAAAIKRTAQFGAGVMGSGIAWVAAKGGEVSLHDINDEAVGRGMAELSRLAKRDKERFARIRPAFDRKGLGHTQAVIEAVLEQIAVKRTLWRELEAAVPSDCLLLTNTSSLSVSEMQEGLMHPERVVGMHFFNPAPKMPLVEIVAGEASSPQAVAATAALAARWGKFPVVVADRPGFLVNRCLMPSLCAALWLLDGGISPKRVDRALKRFGLPMGAIELADRVGLDICRHVADHLHSTLGDRYLLPQWFAPMVESGLRGAKSEAGFFLYTHGKQGEVNPKLAEFLPSTGEARSEALIVDRCLLPMLVEALACLAEGVVEDPDHLDAAMIYGTGFPPFLGGPLHYFGSIPRNELEARIKLHRLPMPENLGVLYGE